MKHTAEFYAKAFELDALLKKSLAEHDSHGKRRTLREAFKLFMKYQEEITLYLKTPEPGGDEVQKSPVGERVVRSSWMLLGLQKLRDLRGEIRGT